MNSLSPKLILIGASTGGPGLIEQILIALPQKISVAIVIAQHMQSGFLKSFAKRLRRLSDIEVLFAKDTTNIESGFIYLLSNTSQLFSVAKEIKLIQDSKNSTIYHPDIDTLFLSASQLKNSTITAYLLSGIGDDGAKGLLALKKNGSYTVAQDEESSIVYGMPKSAYEIDAHCKIMDIQTIVDDIKERAK